MSYESGVKLINFVFSWQDGEFFWGKKCCPLFHTEKEELSKKKNIEAKNQNFVEIFCTCFHELHRHNKDI